MAEQLGGQPKHVPLEWVTPRTVDFTAQFEEEGLFDETIPTSYDPEHEILCDILLGHSDSCDSTSECED